MQIKSRQFCLTDRRHFSTLCVADIPTLRLVVSNILTPARELKATICSLSAAMESRLQLKSQQQILSVMSNAESFLPYTKYTRKYLGRHHLKTYYIYNNSKQQQILMALLVHTSYCNSCYFDISNSGLLLQPFLVQKLILISQKLSRTQTANDNTWWQIYKYIYMVAQPSIT